MKVRVDPAKCQGHALCNRHAPRVFFLREDDGHSIVMLDQIPPELEEEVRRAVHGCPEGAISFERAESPSPRMERGSKNR